MSKDTEFEPGEAPHADDDEGGQVDTRTEVYWPEGKQSEVAKVLTDGADEHGFEQESVQLHGNYFVAPADLVEAVSGDLDAVEADDVEAPKAPAKKATARKRAAKKAPAKKAAAS